MLSRHFLYVYICIVIVDPIIKQAEGGDPILQFTADTFLGQSKPGTGFPSTYVVFFFFNHLKRDVVVCFVDIGGFYFHHCLIFLSINNNFIVFGLCQQGIKLMITLTLYTPSRFYRQ